MPLTPGEILDGKYRIIRLLGEGGMGAVYEGENQRIHRRVAIKVLHASAAAKATSVRRFEQEAKAAGLIGSEHIVEVLDLGSLPSGENYLVMEFLDGETLATRIQSAGRLTPHQAAPIMVQLLDGLAAAHKASIIHRDLKPDNVFLVRSLAGKRDFVKVVDFGVSKFSALESEGMSMTSTGAVVGTPYYLSPEQARGVKQLDARSDIYSSGVVLYQAVTGRLPFHAETFNELVFKIALESPEPAESLVPGLDPAFAAIITRAMVREASGRFQTAEDFRGALSRWLDEHPDASAEGAGRLRVVPGSSAPAPDSSSAFAPTEREPKLDGSTTRPSFLPARGGTVALDEVNPGGVAPSPLPKAPEPTPSMTTPPPIAGSIAATPTAQEPKKKGSLIAIAAVIVLSAGGGAFGAYKLSGGGSQGQASPQATASVTAETQAAPPKTAAPEATSAAAPAQTTTSTASAAPIDTSIPKPDTSAPIAAAPGSALKKPVAASTSTPTATPKPTGRVIGGDL